MDRKMKNVLILCDAFPPAFNPRMGYLCKYLREYGWNPIIITEYTPQNIYENLAEGQDVTYINYYCSNNKLAKTLRYIFVFFADLLFNYKNIVIRHKAKKEIEKRNISVILSSSFRVYPACAASELSQRYKIPFVMDLRDIFEQSTNNELISRKFSKSVFLNNLIANIITQKLTHQRNKTLRAANTVCTVSPWHVETLSAFNKNTSLIYNGFDSELFFPVKTKNEKFIIVYTGRIHSIELRDPSLLFEAIHLLSDQKKISPTECRIHFYLMDNLSKILVQDLAAKYAITDYVDYFDTVKSEDIPAILNSSSILLLLANKSTGENSPKGIMGTKIFEYLATEKPILCVRNDEACLEETINMAKAGLAASSATETANFILTKLAEWKENGFTHQNVNKSYIQNFSRKGQAQQFAKLFESL